MTTRLLLLLVTLFLVSGCAVWGSEGGPGGTGLARPSTAPSAAATATGGPDGVQRIEISLGDDLRLRPDTVYARTGILEMTFRNTGVTPHDITVGTAPSMDSGNLNAGQTTTVRLTIDTPGRYPMPCVYHATSGMQGTLVIGGP